MKIELRNLKHSKWASQETDCFQADVWIDGKRAGQVSNDGHGGANDYAPWQLSETLNEYAATLPAVVFTIDGKPHSVPQDADGLIGDALIAKLHERDLKRILSNRVVYVDRQGRLMQTKTTDKTAMARILKMPDLTDRLGAIQVLNLMPLTDALSIYART